MRYSPIVSLALLVLVTGAVMYWEGTRLSPATPAGVPVAFTELSSGVQSSVTRRVNYLITSDDELHALWKLVSTNEVPPTVDFSKNVVVAVFAGNEPTAGYTIKVTKIADAAERMVAVTITAPGVTCLAGGAATAPYQILELPATDLPFAHEDVATTTSCL